MLSEPRKGLQAVKGSRAIWGGGASRQKGAALLSATPCAAILSWHTTCCCKNRDVPSSQTQPGPAAPKAGDTDAPQQLMEVHPESFCSCRTSLLGTAGICIPLSLNTGSGVSFCPLLVLSEHGCQSWEFLLTLAGAGCLIINCTSSSNCCSH